MSLRRLTGLFSKAEAQEPKSGKADAPVEDGPAQSFSLFLISWHTNRTERTEDRGNSVNKTQQCGIYNPGMRNQIINKCFCLYSRLPEGDRSGKTGPSWAMRQPGRLSDIHSLGTVLGTDPPLGPSALQSPPPKKTLDDLPPEGLLTLLDIAGPHEDLHPHSGTANDRLIKIQNQTC